MADVANKARSRTAPPLGSPAAVLSLAHAEPRTPPPPFPSLTPPLAQNPFSLLGEDDDDVKPTEKKAPAAKAAPKSAAPGALV